MNPGIAKIVIAVGVLLVIAGIIFYFFGDKLNWFGKLPGDIRYESGNTKVYFPLTTMIILTILINVVIWLVKKFL